MIRMNYEYTEALYHYGIKGMRWGIRRTAAELGHAVKSGAKKIGSAVKASSEKRKRKRAEKDEKKRQKVAKAQQKEADRRAKDEAAKEQDRELKKETILKSRSAKLLYENADLFTTQELQNAYNRLVLEKNISSMVPQEISKGKKIVDGYISVGTKVSDVLATTNKMVSNAKRFNELVTGKKPDKNNKPKSSNDKKTSNNPVVNEGKKIVNEMIDDFAKDFTDFDDFMKTQTAQHFSNEGKKYYRDKFMKRK